MDSRTQKRTAPVRHHPLQRVRAMQKPAFMPRGNFHLRGLHPDFIRLGFRILAAEILGGQRVRTEFPDHRRSGSFGSQRHIHALAAETGEVPDHPCGQVCPWGFQPAVPFRSQNNFYRPRLRTGPAAKPEMLLIEEIRDGGCAVAGRRA